MQGAADDAKAQGADVWFSDPTSYFAGKGVCGDPEQVHGIVKTLVQSDEPIKGWPLIITRAASTAVPVPSREVIRWTSRHSDQIAACRAELEHEYVTAVDDDGEPRFLPVVSERARAKLNGLAAKMTRPPKQKARPLAKLREEWKESAIRTSGVAADVINCLLEYARAAAAAIRARVADVVDVALAAVDVAATVFVMNHGGRFRRRHLLAEARRHLALVLRGRRREPGLDEQIVEAALATY